MKINEQKHASDQNHSSDQNVETDTTRMVLRERRAAYELLHKLNVKEQQDASLRDRREAFARIMRFSNRLPKRIQTQSAEGDRVAELWRKIRDRHAVNR